MDVVDRINICVELYECVHIQHVDDYSEIDIWGTTNRKAVVPNEHTKIITIDENLKHLIITDAMHGSVIGEYGKMVFENIELNKTEIYPSKTWENGVLVVIYHTNGGKTILDFFN